MGTTEGAKRAAETIRKRYGNDFYSNIGARGGSVRVPKGFHMMDPEKLRKVGRKGGAALRRTKK